MFDGKGEWSLAGATEDLFTQDEMKKILSYDPAQAKQLISGAGYPNGVDIEFMYNAAYGDTFNIKAQLLQSQLKKAGINLTLKPLLNGEDAARRRTGDYQFNITPRGQGVPQDVDSYVYGMYHPKSPDNYGHVDDPQLTPLLEAQRRELDATKRRDILRQAVERINSVPWGLTLFYGPGYALYQQRLKNYAPNVAYPYGRDRRRRSGSRGVAAAPGAATGRRLETIAGGEHDMRGLVRNAFDIRWYLDLHVCVLPVFDVEFLPLILRAVLFTTTFVHTR